MLQTFNEQNKDIYIYVKDGIYHRSEAKVSVFDSVVQGGDAVWEGLRIYNGGVFKLDAHLNRLMDSAHAMAFENIPSKEDIVKCLYATLNANQMYDDVHARLTLTRGEKITSGMDPRLNQFGPNLIILPEWKPLVYDNDNGITVITSAIRRNSPSFLDSKIHHNNLINNILAKIQANHAGADAALMLDNSGFAAELNGSNIFSVKDGTLYTPFADACLHGITRSQVLDLAKENNISHMEKNLSLTEIFSADELFCTGTWGELTPIVEVDGRKIINKTGSSVTKQLQLAFKQDIDNHLTQIDKTINI
jgi:branched-chain amino acid aminotransferase